MKRYVIFDTKNGDCFNDILDTEDREKAVDIFRREWAALSAHDQKQREQFELVYCEVDEDEIPDLETAEVIETIR